MGGGGGGGGGASNVDAERAEFGDITMPREGESGLPGYLRRGMTAISTVAVDTLVKPLSDAFDEIFPVQPPQTAADAKVRLPCGDADGGGGVPREANQPCAPLFCSGQQRFVWGRRATACTRRDDRSGRCECAYRRCGLGGPRRCRRGGARFGGPMEGGCQPRACRGRRRAADAAHGRVRCVRPAGARF